MSELPSLHGPNRPFYVRDFYGPPELNLSRLRLVKPLRFRWRMVGGEWVEDESDLVPHTFPAPLPDYTPEEQARIDAAEAKRARKIAA